jgi:hypothetical protein
METAMVLATETKKAPLGVSYTTAAVAAADISYDLLAACQRQEAFYYQVNFPFASIFGYCLYYVPEYNIKVSKAAT